MARLAGPLDSFAKSGAKCFPGRFVDPAVDADVNGIVLDR
jgi:hypothetical protein